jgi:DNA-binding NarL/FixJ family response regulator
MDPLRPKGNEEVLYGGGQAAYAGSVGGKKRIVIVDDQRSFLERWRAFLEERYPGRVEVETFTDPLSAVRAFSPAIHLLMVDLEMPVLDGRKLVEVAAAQGVDRRRIVVTSAWEAERLHDLFPKGSCLAVINKNEARQQAAFLMILDSIMRKP